MSRFDPMLAPKPIVARRLEVLTGLGAGGEGEPDDKAQLVDEILAPAIATLSSRSTARFLTILIAGEAPD